MPAPFALTHLTIVTGDIDGTLLDDHTVVVDGSGTITHVAPSAEVTLPPGTRSIDATGRFVLPGLVNAHAHLFSDGLPISAILLNESTSGIISSLGRGPLGQWVFRKRTRANAITQLHSGVTTLRSVGDVGYEVLAIANEIDAGKFLGPRILASGPLLAITGGHGAPQIALTSDSPWQARRHARTNIQRGVKAIKISATAGVTDARDIGYAGRPEMSQEEMTGICEEAHNAGILVAAHAQSTAGIAAALRAGVDTIEHGAALDDETIGLFLDNPRSLRGHSALIPTLQACLPLVKLDQSITGVSDIVHANATLVWEEMLQGISMARDHGVTIGMGTDSAITYVTHYNVWRELDLLVRHGGFTRAEALNAATSTNAAIIGVDQVTGSIEVGKSADLVLLRDNPLEDFRRLTEPVMVIARGNIIDSPSVTRFADLDAHLDSL